MNGWKAATFLLLGGLVYAVLLGAQMKRDRDAVTAYYVNAAKHETRMAETRLALKERERQAVAQRLDSAVTAYAKQRARIRYVSRTPQPMTTDSAIQAVPSASDSAVYTVPAEYIEAADSVVSTCTLLRATCDAAMQEADSTVQAYRRLVQVTEAQLKAERKGKWMERLSTALIWGAAGYAAGMLNGK